MAHALFYLRERKKGDQVVNTGQGGCFRLFSETQYLTLQIHFSRETKPRGPD